MKTPCLTIELFTSSNAKQVITLFYMYVYLMYT